MPSVKVYGADWCSMTRRTLGNLERLGVEHEYIDVERNTEASRWVKEQSGGKEKKPTLDIGGKVLITPSEDELEEALREERLLT